MTRPGLLSTWGRRVISIPLVIALAVLCWAGLPLWLFAAGLLDGAHRSLRRLPRLRAVAFFALFTACEVLGLTAATFLGLATLGGRLVGSRRYVRANAALQRWWTSTLFWGSVWLFSMRVETEGIDQAGGGPLLLFVRHASTADTVLAAALIANPRRLLLRYVLKRELLWDPCVDIVGRRLPNAFVDRRSTVSSREIDTVAQLASDLDQDSAVLIYPEGTRFSERKRSAAVAALRRRQQHELADLAEGYRNVLPPKLGGPLALFDLARGADLVLVEHTGLEGAGSFREFWRGELVGKTLRVRIRRIPAHDIPATDRDRWLFERWAETDRWISRSRAE